jgi:hypothetical protein
MTEWGVVQNKHRCLRLRLSMTMGWIATPEYDPFASAHDDNGGLTMTMGWVCMTKEWIATPGYRLAMTEWGGRSG